MILGLTEFLQSRDPLFSIISVSEFPSVEKHVVVSRNVEELHVLVTGARREDFFESIQLGQFVLVSDQMTNVVRCKVLDDLVYVILAIAQISVQRLFVPLLIAQGRPVEP